MLIVHDSYWNRISIFYYKEDGELWVEHELSIEDCWTNHRVGIKDLEVIRKVFADSIIYDSIEEDTIPLED